MPYQQPYRSRWNVVIIFAKTLKAIPVKMNYIKAVPRNEAMLQCVAAIDEVIWTSFSFLRRWHLSQWTERVSMRATQFNLMRIFCADLLMTLHSQWWKWIDHFASAPTTEMVIAVFETILILFFVIFYKNKKYIIVKDGIIFQHQMLHKYYP